MSDKLIEACKRLLEGPVDEPQIDLAGDYQTGLFCGLEDNGMQGDAYDACIYGFEKGVERALEWAQGIIESAMEEQPAVDEPAKGRSECQNC